MNAKLGDEDKTEERYRALNEQTPMPGLEFEIDELANPGLPPLMRIINSQKTEQFALIFRRNELTTFRIQP